MFIAIPLETKPSWRSPPWITLLLIAINCWVYFGWQAPEARAVERAAEKYVDTPLPQIELPAYAKDVQARASQWQQQWAALASTSPATPLTDATRSAHLQALQLLLGDCLHQALQSLYPDLHPTATTVGAQSQTTA